MRSMKALLSTVGLLLSLGIGCTNKTPDRDHIPVLRKKLFDLQQAVASKNRAAVDSLLSIEILEVGEDTDSLLRYVYGTDGSFSFRQFGKAEYFYTRDKARIDCFIMDSLATEDRPMTFTLILDGGRWLFKRFEPGLKRPSDTMTTDSNDSIE